jgi:hypothetical protein
MAERETVAADAAAFFNTYEAFQVNWSSVKWEKVEATRIPPIRQL